MAGQLDSTLKILRRKQVESETGYSRSTIYLRISQGLWPKPVSLGARAVGWPAAEVATMNAARITYLRVEKGWADDDPLFPATAVSVWTRRSESDPVAARKVIHPEA